MNKYWTWGEFFKEFAWKGFLLCLGLAIICGISLFIYKSATADGKVDYCQIVSCRSAKDDPRPFCLYGHRKWRSNISYGDFTSIEEAQKEMVRLRCPDDILK